MTEQNLADWNALARPPATALREIQAGRLKGKTDINPQWRYKALTEQYGPCGQGWKFTVERLWYEDAADGQRFAFAEAHLWVKRDDEWQGPMPGVGGSMLLEQEKAGLHANDEG